MDRADRSTVRRALVLLGALALAMAGVSATPRGVLAQDAPRILFIPNGSVPARLRRSLSTLLRSRGQLVSYEDYAAAASAEHLRPSGRAALQRIAPQQSAAVIVVASYGGHYRRRVLRVRFLNGQTGELVTSSSHGMQGLNLRASSQHAILRDLDQVTGGSGNSGSPSPPPTESTSPATNGEASGDGGGLPPPLDWEEETPDGEGEAGPPPPPPEDEAGEGEEVPLEEQAPWGFAVSAGGGIMNRGSTIPTMAGNATLTTLPFPAIQAEILGSFRPDLSSRLRLEFVARYTTSVGLVAEDERVDGSTRSTDLRAHHFRIGFASRIPLAPGRLAPVLLLELNYSLRMLDSEIAVSIPDYTLGGVALRVGLFFVIGDSPISLGIVPEVGHAQNLSDDLSQTAQVSDGFVVGAEAVVRIQLIQELALILMYREAHAFMESDLGEQLTDAERYGILRLEYRF